MSQYANIMPNHDSPEMIAKEQPVSSKTQTIEFSQILSPALADFEAVNLLIQNALQSDVPLIAEVNDYLINSGGKRLRPLVALLCGQVLGGKNNPNQHKLATAVEFLHNATLLHDDVVDESALRRGKKTSHTVWGNATSILVGDFLISRSLQLLTQIGSLPVLEVFAETTNLIAEGEVLQLIHCKNPHTTMDQYLQVIERKTAKMFEAAAKGAAMIAECDTDLTHALAAYALHLGNSFQMIDDILDFTGNTHVTGKNIGDDLAEGKITLPFLLALEQVNEADKNTLIAAFNANLKEELPLDEMIGIIVSSGAIEKSYQLASSQIDSALTHLSMAPEGEAKDALKALAQFSLMRQQ